MMSGVHWYAVRDGDPRALALYLRHYSHKRYGHPRWSRQFVGGVPRMILMTSDAQALFAWKLERLRRDAQHGVNCSIFRNEGPLLSSILIHEADELAWQRWPDEDRHFTFVNHKEIRSTNPGYCFIRAGWRRCGMTKGGLVILERVRVTEAI